MSESDALSHQLDVLLVEDSPIQVKIVKHVVDDLPIFNLVHVAGDGEQAMAYLHREGEHSQAVLPDVVLCDINMPRKGGFEVLAEVRADPQLRSIPFVMLTTSEAEEDIVRAYKEGANTFISKPIDLLGLENVLNHFAHYWCAAKYALDVKSGQFDPGATFIVAAGHSPDDVRLEHRAVSVLVVEDSPTQAMTIRTLISEVEEFQVLDVAEDGELAMTFLRREGQYAEAQRPHLIVLDLNLPNKDGFEVLRDVKSDPHLRDIIVVVLTVRDHPEDIVRCYNEGANTFLAKPVTAEGMRAVLHRFAAYWADEATKLPR